MTRLGLERWAACCLLGCAVVAGCGDDGGADADAGDAATLDDGATVDAFVPDGSGFSDGGVRCELDEDCVDGVECTRDVCDPSGFCRNPVDIASCSDGIFCNGVEQCDLLRGCIPGPPESCNDSDACTIDSCDEAEKLCRHEPRDFDGDGEVDWHCEDASGELGTDCDDRDPSRGSMVAEVCMDDEDNDCDGEVDEADCGRPMYDTCDSPLDVSAGGTFVVSTAGASEDYDISCGGLGWRDLVFQLTLTEPRDVDISADGEGVTAVSLRTTCDDRATELDCTNGFPGRVRERALEAGTYFIVVSDSRVGEMVLDVTLDDPTDPPTNETCASPIDVGAGGTFTGSLVDVADDITTSCGSSSAPDLTYTFTTTESHNVRLGLLSTTGETMTLSVRSTCDDAGTEIRCAEAQPVDTVLYELPAGTYYVVVEGPTYREVDYQLDVELLPPTPAPVGDNCSSPIALDLDTVTTGTTVGMQDDYAISCGFDDQDAVYSFTLTEPRDVILTVDGDTTYMRASIRTTCDDGATELRCAGGRPSRSIFRNMAAGTYYVIAEAFRGTSFDVNVETSAPTAPTVVSGNETCETALVVPATGGLFSGDTTTMIDDYQTRSSCGSGSRGKDAAFELTLASSQRVIASTAGSAFDTVLYLHEAMCVSSSERYCNDDSGTGDTTSLVDRTLSAGTWFVVVDGRGTADVGEYQLELFVSDP